jgi:hypothetical protein
VKDWKFLKYKEEWRKRDGSGEEQRTKLMKKVWKRRGRGDEVDEEGRYKREESKIQ